MKRPSRLPVVIAALGAMLAFACSASPKNSIPPEIRVVLADGAELAQVGGDLDWQAGGVAIGRSTDVVDVKLSAFGVKAEVGGKINEAPRLIARAAHSFVRFGGQHYRGRLEFFPSKDGGVVVLNVLPLEDYLLGVVPSEMPSGWPAEALKAQAIAARTYALSRMAVRNSSSFDVYATVADQAYRGVVGEDPRSSAAVHETAGMVVTYEGDPIVAYYCSDCGGCTSQGEQPYLRSVEIDVPESPHKYWSVSLEGSELDEAIRGTGGRVGKVESIIVERDAFSGHLCSIEFRGAGGSHSISGSKLRRIVGYGVMKSTRVAVEPIGDNVEKTVLEMPEVKASSSATPPKPVRTTAVIPAVNTFDAAVLTQSNGDMIEVGAAEVMQGWHKPWVSSGDVSGEQKMRVLYAFDGDELLKCNREVHLWSASGVNVVAYTSEVADTENDEELEKPATDPGILDMPLLPPPTHAGEAVTRVQYSRKGGIQGIVLHGSGYGHGMGMSQWGAKELAQRGHSFKEILSYFYQGTTIESWSGALPQALASPHDEEAVEVHEFYQPFIPATSGG